MKPNESEEKLDVWLRRINETDMPVLSKTIQEINRITSNENSPLSALTKVILHDPSMTAHVLRLANSAYYHTGNRPEMNTVSRAVMMLGFNEIKSICLFSAVISDLLKGKPHERLLSEMALGFQSAVQARRLAIARGDRDPEEVFVAALLYNFGELAFHCYGGELSEKLEKEMLRVPEGRRQSVEVKVLGFKLRDLTHGIGRMWKFGSFFESVVVGGTNNQRAKGVILSHKFAHAVKQGWDSPEVVRMYQEMSRELGIKEEELEPILQSSAEEAVEIAKLYGAQKAARFVTLPGDKAVAGEVQGEEVEEGPEWPQPDPMLQLKILREMMAMLQVGPEYNQVLEMVLEGLNRGSGLDRALFAILTPDRTVLIGKTAVGLRAVGIAEQFVVNLEAGQANIFFEVLESRKPIWIEESDWVSRPGIFPKRAFDLLGKGPFFLAPVVSNDKTIGIFYADRRESNRALDAECFDSFQAFIMQANMCLSFLGSMKGKAAPSKKNNNL